MIAAVSIWALATVGHVLLTARWLGLSGFSRRTRDEWWFATMVVAIGTLSMALHIAAILVGISLLSVIGLLAAGHVVAGRLAGSPPTPPVPLPHEQPDLVTRTLESAAILVLAAIAVEWVRIAAPSYRVTGTDAAHYHVPNAVNLALGRSVFELGPTMHLYPMGSSTLAAWFIVPVGDPLLTDVTMLLPFLLLVAAAGWIFRVSTGLSGLAWTPWAMLALFSTPLFRVASQMSADLMLTASFSATAAVVLAAFAQRRVSSADVVVMGIATGLLLGAKTTGLIAALVVAVPAFLILPVVTRKTAGPGYVRPTGLAWFVAAACAIGSGGIWLVKNWWLWGSPISPIGLKLAGIEIFHGIPHEPTTYLSVLGDMQEDPTYPLWDRTSRYIRRWLGDWYLHALVPIAFIPIDAAIAWVRGTDRRGAVLRLTVAAAIVATGIPVAWVLMGAPWTSLDRSHGLSLRFLQPWFALLPILSLIALFPASARWYAERARTTVAGLLAVCASVVALAMNTAPPFPPTPTIFSVTAGAAVWVLLRTAVRSVRRAMIAAWVVIAVGSLGFGLWVAGLDRAGRVGAAARMEKAGPRTQAQQVYVAALAAEQRRRRACTTRRFFITTRFDEPLGLQGIPYTNLVFYAAREVAVTRAVRAPIGRCDYIVSDRAVLATEKGQALIAALDPSGTTVELAETRDFVLIGIR